MSLEEFEDFLLDNSCLDPESVANTWYEIKRDIKILRCLQASGVDNWEWYGDALEGLEE